MITNTLGAIVGWRYIPDFATRLLLPYFHTCYTKMLHRLVPAANTVAYHRHYRYVYAFVVLAYLFWNFREAALSTEPNFYEILGVVPTADEGTLKMAFRQFAKKNHPDRVGSSGETLFMEVRDAFEALKNPTTRFAYDRFGPDALGWKSCTTLREYIRHGLMHSAGYYIVTGCGLFLWTALSSQSSTTFWRYILFLFQLGYELLFILSPSPSSSSSSSVSSFFLNPASPYSGGILFFLWPNRVAYQHVKFLHSLFLLITMALIKVSPVLFDHMGAVMSNPQRMAIELSKLNAMAQAVDKEASNIIQLDLHSCHYDPNNDDTPFRDLPAPEDAPPPSEAIITALSKELENMVIESKLFTEPGPLKSAVETAVEKRRKSSQIQLTQPLSSPTRIAPSNRSPMSSPLRGGEGLTSRPFGSPVRGWNSAGSPLASPRREGGPSMQRVSMGILERRAVFRATAVSRSLGGSREGYVRGRSQSL